MSALLPAYTLWLREMVRFVRQKNRVFGALGQPLLFWLLFGSSFSASFRPSLSVEMGYLEYFFPGILTMILLFTAIFSSFSIIEDRKEGFLQAVLVSPASRLSIVLGKVSGGATLALLQALLFLCLAPLAHIHLTVWSVLALVLVLWFLGLALSALGFCLAWRMDSVQGFHAIMMLILMPLWFLSGAFFPATGLPWIIKSLMMVNPLTYGLSLIRHIVYWNSPELLLDLPSFAMSFGILVLFGVGVLLISWRSVRRS